MDCLSGTINCFPKTSSYYVRCVKGQQLTVSFTDNGDGTVTDNTTGLMWQKQDDGTWQTWEQVLTFCEGMNLATFSDWRLPNIKELVSITDLHHPTYFDPVFTGSKASPYWSSTTRDQFYPFTFSKYVGIYPRGAGYARCVRGQ